jgi:carboxyl-terminal processing protease
VRGCADCTGFVLDLRGNMGGLVALVPAVAAWFVAEHRTLGTVKSPMAAMKLVVSPRAEAFSGRLAVLVDPLTVSSAEFLAAGLKDIGRARLFGETTQGAALPSSVEMLPDGDRFQFATADYVSAAGAAVEGAGVTPHEAVRLTRNAVLTGHDPALEAALAWLSAKD